VQRAERAPAGPWRSPARSTCWRGGGRSSTRGESHARRVGTHALGVGVTIDCACGAHPPRLQGSKGAPPHHAVTRERDAAALSRCDETVQTCVVRVCNADAEPHTPCGPASRSE